MPIQHVSQVLSLDDFLGFNAQDVRQVVKDHTSASPSVGRFGGWMSVACNRCCSRATFPICLRFVSLALKGIYLYWTYFIILPGVLTKWKLPRERVGSILLGVPSNSILSPGIRIFLENLRKPRGNGSGFWKEGCLKIMEKESNPRVALTAIG